MSEDGDRLILRRCGWYPKIPGRYRAILATIGEVHYYEFPQPDVCEGFPRWRAVFLTHVDSVTVDVFANLVVPKIIRDG